MQSQFAIGRRTVAPLLANTTYTRKDSGTSFNNSGAAGTVAVTLPSDAVRGDTFEAACVTAQSLQIKAGASAVFILAGTALTAGHGVSSATPGSTTTLECLGANSWLVRGATGWADQA